MPIIRCNKSYFSADASENLEFICKKMKKSMKSFKFQPNDLEKKLKIYYRILHIFRMVIIIIIITMIVITNSSNNTIIIII